MQLSGGEQQRLAFARALLVKPDWLFLDEATSALDGATEARMYELLQQRLAGATVVSIAHRPAIAAYHQQTWQLVPTDDGSELRAAAIAGSDGGAAPAVERAGAAVAPAPSAALALA
jgi:ABC-type uncharacterized transport system fused permease/ATPase subunit